MNRNAYPKLRDWTKGEHAIAALTKSRSQGNRAFVPTRKPEECFIHVRPMPPTKDST
jgi:hypothetical protein